MAWKGTPLTEDHCSLEYRIVGNDRVNTPRQIEVHATPDELARFAREGYFVRPALLSPDHIQRLKQAMDEIAEQELAEGAVSLSESREFGGVFLRHLMDKHPAFLELLHFEPTLSVARAMLGPQIQALPVTARISYPTQKNQETKWHFHQRCIPDPMPPWFCRPHVIDCLLYLDEVNEANGQICVVPGSHERIHEELPADQHGSLPGEVALSLPAGSCVMIHGALWHRATPTRPDGEVRRLIILPYAAAWIQLPTFGKRPTDGLTQSLRADADFETSELLGDAERIY
jgi:ectoine hydroxylase-related dioxygenase (phytanoyl-CoA dioxygenase family)